MKPPIQFLREPSTAAICGLLFAVTCAAYWPSLNNDFVNLDDPRYVYANAQVRAGLTGPGLKWAFTTTEGGLWHRLTWLSLMLDAELSGQGARGYHWTNLLLHAANTALLFLCLRRITGATSRSAFVAGLFGLHPLHVESVAWISERKDVLSTLFWIL